MSLSSGLAQSSLFTEVPLVSAQFNPNEYAKYQAISTSVNALSVKLVNLGSILQIQQNGQLKFVIPGNPDTVKAEIKKIEERGTLDYTCFAQIEGGGHLAFIVNQNAQIGFIQTNTHFYSIRSVRDGLCVLLDHNLAASKGEACEQLGDIQPRADVDPCGTDDDCHAIVKVLVLVTPEARSFLSTLSPLEASLWIQMGMYSVNFAFENSDVPNKSVRWEIVPFYFYFDPSNVYQYDINNLPGAAASIRSQYKADLVVLLSDGRYPDIAGVANGLGPSFNNSFAIVEIPQLWGPRWTLAHEIAHLFGADHNTSANAGVSSGGNDNPGCNHGYRFVDGLGVPRRTIMALTPNGTQRILHYSNPHVTINGTPTGVSDGVENNANVIRQTGCAVADHFSSRELAIWIDGPSTACDNNPRNFCAYVSAPELGLPGGPPYQYEWRWNTSGIFSTIDPGVPADPGTFISNNQCITVGCLAPIKYWLQLRVTSADGISIVTQKLVITRMCGAAGCSGFATEGDDRTLLNSLNDATTSIQIIPNPASASICKFILRSTEKRIIEARILDVNGRVLKSLDKFEVAQGENNLPINISTLEDGVYYCQVRSLDKVMTAKFAINNK